MMGTIVNETRNSTASVERFIGTAYDKMAALYDNLDTLLAIHEQLLEGGGSWIGVYEEHPTARRDGSAIQDGDKYYNSLMKKTLLYINGSWISENLVSLGVELVTINNSHRVGDDTVITLSSAYAPGTNGITVFVGPTYQYSQEVDASGAYEETDENTITFTDVLLEDDTRVVIISNVAESLLEVNVQCKTGLYIVETNGQTVIPLPDGLSYAIGVNNLSVFVNGAAKYSGYDYYETSTTTITTSVGLTAGDKVIFRYGEMVSNTSDGDPITVYPLLASMYQNTPDTTKPVLVSSGYTAGDGSGGTFVWDVSFDKAEANGITAIDPNVALVDQGTNTGNGCWIRNYEGFIYPAWWNVAERGMTAIRYLDPMEGDLLVILGTEEGSFSGGGIFAWDPLQEWENHDGVDIISPNVSVAVTHPDWTVAVGTADGCWIRLG